MTSLTHAKIMQRYAYSASHEVALKSHTPRYEKITHTHPHTRSCSEVSHAHTQPCPEFSKHAENYVQNIYRSDHRIMCPPRMHKHTFSNVSQLREFIIHRTENILQTLACLPCTAKLGQTCFCPLTHMHTAVRCMLPIYRSEQVGLSNYVLRQ